MNATITRQIIQDLLPAYLSGEASEDTRKLVDDYARQDADVAFLIKEGLGAAKPQPVAADAVRDLEMLSLRRTRRYLRTRSLCLALGLFFTLMIFSFHFDSGGIRWIGEESLILPIGFAIGATMSWYAYFRYRRRLKGMDL